jgi:hypothetical protein
LFIKLKFNHRHMQSLEMMALMEVFDYNCIV